MAWGQRRRALSTSEIEANRAAKAKREADAMTCQVCGRKILANTGPIAHHGYQRPWEGGYQTSSCFGARKEPFEAERSTLKTWIGFMKAKKHSLEARIEAVNSETSGMLISYREIHKSRQQLPTLFTLERGNFAAMKAEHGGYFRYKSGKTFDEIKNQWLAAEEWKRQSLAREIQNQQRRYDGWKETHTFVNQKWEAL